MKHRTILLSRVVLASAIALACASAPAVAAGRANLGSLGTASAFDQFIVKYRDGTAERADATASDRALARAARSVAGTRALGVRHLRRMSVGAEVVRSDRKLDRAEAETLMRSIAADPAVEYVEVDAKMYPVYTPNDPQFPAQWHYQDTAGGIDAADAWNTNTGSGIVVAVLDTGSTAHSDLNANTVAGYDFIIDTFVSRDGNGRDNNPADPGDWNPVAGECYPGSPIRNSSWHGTHVAGTIGALTNNGIGVAGVAHGARIQHVRVLGRCGGYTSDIADGIVWASGGTVSGVPANATPAQVINMSLGGSGACSSTYQNAINTAVNRGATVVVAAGNSNGPVSNFQPASCANVISVGATDSNGARAGFSNYGAGVDIAAPGVSVLSTLNSGTQAPAGESYAYYNGTSMAAPHVAGVAALAQSRRTAIGLARFTPSQLETHLKNTARAFPVAQTQSNGVGIVDAEAAVAAIVPPQPQPPVIYGLWCNGGGSGYCNVSFTGDQPMTFQWSGGYGFSGGSDYYNVCGQVYYPFYTTVEVTLQNPYGTAYANTQVYCTGGPEP